MTYERIRRYRQRLAYGEWKDGHNRGPGVWWLIGLAVGVLALFYAVTCVTGCASAGSVEKIQMELSALKVEIGGGVDTITSVAAVVGLVVMGIIGRWGQLKMRGRRNGKRLA